MNIDKPISWATNPGPIPSASCTKKRNKATPIAISGVMNEKSITKLAVPEPRPRHRSRASAKVTPSGTAMATVRVASFRLCARALRSTGSSQTELTLPTYHSVENPCHEVSERVALNEKSTAIATGRRDQAI
jgi:hypothetical protein